MKQTTAPRPLLDKSDDLSDVEDAMRSLAVGARSERIGGIAVEHLDTGGKRVRARLALAASTALGVAREVATPWAAAVELLHNATLVHDDLQDGDRVRRGRPTTWAAHGMAQAINCGDLMLMLPTLAVAAVDVDDATRFRLSRALHARAVATVRGQAADLALKADLDAGHEPVDCYLTCIEGKTGELFALPVEGAALLAGRSVDVAQALAEPFFVLGMLFQLQDDVLDLFGDKGRDERGADVKEGKISALVVEHLRLFPEDAAWLRAILDAPREDTTDAQVAAVIERFEQGGALDAVLARIVTLASHALNAPALQGEPALQRLVVEVTGMVLAPIQSCFALRRVALIDDVAVPLRALATSQTTTTASASSSTNSSSTHAAASAAE
jgi:geranylgeranyl diphosphate synthase type I